MSIRRVHVCVYICAGFWQSIISSPIIMWLYFFCLFVCVCFSIHLTRARILSTHKYIHTFTHTQLGGIQRSSSSHTYILYIPLHPQRFVWHLFMHSIACTIMWNVKTEKAFVKRKRNQYVDAKQCVYEVRMYLCEANNENSNRVDNQSRRAKENNRRAKQSRTERKRNNKLCTDFSLLKTEISNKNRTRSYLYSTCIFSM